MLLDRFSREDISRLQSTKPKYKDAEHRRYVYRLLDALYRQDCKNVALAGSYGSGKSSILEMFISKARFRGHKVARVSLACFIRQMIRGLANSGMLLVGTVQIVTNLRLISLSGKYWASFYIKVSQIK